MKDSNVHGLGQDVKTGGSAAAVAARTASTFCAKNLDVVKINDADDDDDDDDDDDSLKPNYNTDFREYSEIGVIKE